MDADFQGQVTFYLTGRRSGTALESIEGLGLRPALLARFRDLSTLRYDYPLVLASDGSVVSLSGLVDGKLAGLAEDRDIERLRHHALRLERVIRKRVVPGSKARLSAIWREAEGELLRDNKDSALEESLARLKTAPGIAGMDGDVVACDRDLPDRLFTRVWEAGQGDKSRHMRGAIDHLLIKLRDIVLADDANSEEGLSAQRLRASVGRPFEEEIDFGAMSNLLTTAKPMVTLSRTRRERVERVIATLETQSFFPAGSNFVFRSCGEALGAYAERLPKVLELAKALSIAGLEIDGRYKDGVHDAMFDALGASDLDPADLAKFPDYLVSVDAAKLDASETAKLMEALSSGLPVKVLVRTDEIDSRVKQLSSAAMGLGGVYVLQSASSNLYRYRDRISRGLSYEGPALFCVYSGTGESAGDLPPYLAAAAAMESRAFPAFTYDPSAGSDWASRFSLSDNPQADRDWPVHDLTYEDESLQRVSREVAFTLADFLGCDGRYARHFARVPNEKWNGSMISVPDSIAVESRGLPEKVPCLFMVDSENRLHLVLVDGKLIREARRCREQWRSLQELGGIHNSHAERLLESERRAWEERLTNEMSAAQARETSVPGASPAAPLATAAASPGSEASAGATMTPAGPAAPPQPAEARRTDEAYVDSTRCTSCNECMKVNDRMFKYNGNKQAYIADLKAGTYADLVTAAENCQVAIIHPGKPWNPNEPGLEELLKRAEAFR